MGHWTNVWLIRSLRWLGARSPPVLGAGAHDLLPSQKSYRTESFLSAIDAVAKEHGASRTAVALAWLLKHPSGIQPIVGSINPDRIRLAAKADELELSRDNGTACCWPLAGSRCPEHRACAAIGSRISVVHRVDNSGRD